MIVNQRRQQRMRRCDRMKITGKMQIHIFHRHNLRIAATSGAALHAKIRPQRRLANADHRFFANPVQTIAKTNRRRRLALASRRRIDRCHQNQLAIRPILQRIDKGLTDLRLVMTKGQKMFTRHAKIAANLLHREFICFPRDFDICFSAHDYCPIVMPAVMPAFVAHSAAGTLPSSARTRFIRIRPPSACTVTPSSVTDTTSPGVPVPSTRALS